MFYVISDLHGYPFEKFQELLKKAEFTDADYLFVLGDVIDRGMDGIKYLKWLPNIHLLAIYLDYIYYIPMVTIPLLFSALCIEAFFKDTKWRKCICNHL